MTGSPKEPENATQEGQFRWGGIYSSVLGFTVVIILLLYLFSQHYTG